MNKLTVKEAIATMAKAGFTFNRKERDEYSEMMDYYFTKEGRLYSWTLSGLRVRAERQQWVMWAEEHAAQLERGIQMSLFSDWDIEEMSVS